MAVVPSYTSSVARHRAENPSPTYQRGDFATPNAFGAGVGKALEGFGGQVEKVSNDLERIGLQYRAREQQVEAFDTETRFNQFNERMVQQQTELQRQAPPNGKGMLEGSTKLYDDEAEKFYKTVPSRLQPAMAPKLANLRGQYSEHALKTQLQIEDKFFKTEINGQITKDSIYLDQDPEQLEQRKVAIDDYIDKAGLPESEKKELKRLAAINLERASFKGQQRRDPEKAKRLLGVGEAGDIDTVTNKVIGMESGGAWNAKNPKSSATGTGQFIESTWLSMMRKYKPEMIAGMSQEQILNLRLDEKLSREMVTHNLEEGAEALGTNGMPKTAGNIYLTHFLGKGGAVNVLSSDPTKSVSLILPENVMNANPFLKGKTVGDVISWADQKMGGKGAVMMKPRGDPRYANIPYDERIVLTQDALQQSKADDNQRRQASIAVHNNQMNEMLTGIHDGTLGAADIMSARQTWMTDFKDIERVENVLKARREKIGSLEEASTWLMNPNFVADPTDTNNKKRADALFDADNGAQRLAKNDQEYLTKALFPLIDKTEMIPGNAVGVLKGMLRDQSKIGAAMSIMDQMERLAPQTFSQSFGADDMKQLLSWRVMKDFLPPEEITKRMTESLDPNKREGLEKMRKEAKDAATKVPTGDILQYFDKSYFSAGPDAPANPIINATMHAEFIELYSEMFVSTGSHEEAQKGALKMLGTNWGANNLGGDNRLMKYPPTGAVAGKFYPTIAGSYEWMQKQADRQVREIMTGDQVVLGTIKKLQPGTSVMMLPGGAAKTTTTEAPLPKYWLQPDERTEAEIAQGKRPGYQVIVQDEFGRYLALQNKKGQAIRMDFDPTADSIKHAEELQKKVIEDRKADAYRGNPFKPTRGGN